jgi:hypothetical protein
MRWDTVIPVGVAQVPPEPVGAPRVAQIMRWDTVIPVSVAQIPPEPVGAPRVAQIMRWDTVIPVSVAQIPPEPVGAPRVAQIMRWDIIPVILAQNQLGLLELLRLWGETSYLSLWLRTSWGSWSCLDYEVRHHTCHCSPEPVRAPGVAEIMRWGIIPVTVAQIPPEPVGAPRVAQNMRWDIIPVTVAQNQLGLLELLRLWGDTLYLSLWPKTS